MRSVLLAGVAVCLAAGVASAQSVPADIQPHLATYVRVAAGWVADQKCHFLTPDQAAVFNANVEQNTLRLGAALDASVGKQTANNALGYMQQQGAAYASANFGDCGNGARDAVSRAQSETVTINDGLSSYSTQPSAK